MTSLIRTNRSSNGMNALFIALTVNHCSSLHPYPNASTSRASSRDIEVPLISRLSVLTVTRNRRSRRSPMGCSAIEGAAPVCTLDDGHSSSGIRLSRTYAASRPSTLPVMSSTMRTPWPSRSAPHHCSACQMPGGRVPRLGAGDVEADHPEIAVPDGQLGDLHRTGRVAHCGEQCGGPDRGTRLGRLGAAVAEPGQYRLDGLVQ